MVGAAAYLATIQGGQCIVGILNARASFSVTLKGQVVWVNIAFEYILKYVYH
jgi:hypothetical protein